MVMGDLVREVDVVVVGGGPGGYSAAFRAAELGLDTVVVDAGKRLGGACLFEGCIPSKALLHVAHVMHEVERAREIGVEYGEPKVSIEALRAWKDDRVIAKLARGLAGVALRRGVEVIGGRAVFEGSRALRVEGDTPQKIRFKHAIVATGSLPAVLPGLGSGTAARDGLDGARSSSPRSPPSSSSSAAATSASSWARSTRRWAAAVTLVEMTDGLLPGVDRDLVQPLARRIDKLFAAVHLRSRVAAVRAGGGRRRGRDRGQGARSFDRVLVAVGRRAAERRPRPRVDPRPDRRARRDRHRRAVPHRRPPHLRGRRRDRRAHARSPRDAAGPGRGRGHRGPGVGIRQRGGARGRVHRSRGGMVRAHRARGQARPTGP